MQERNRDKLMQQSLYDLLTMMNKRANPKMCVLDLLGDKQCRCDKYTCEKYKPGCRNSCKEEYKCCNQCIADYLNEYPF